jgi:DNA-directed RNA polymerase subunit RPC12/RpoP
MSSVDWNLGGLTDINGNLGKPVPSGQVLVPGKIDLEGEAIRWELGGPARLQEVSRSTLNEFVKLWQSDSAAILRFAKRWGVLAIQPIGRKEPVLYRPCGEAMTEGSDPIAAWRYFSHRAYAVLNIVAALRQGKLGDLADWGVIAAIEDNRESYKAAIAEHKYGLGFTLFPKPWPNRNVVEQGRHAMAAEAVAWLTCWRTQRMQGFSDFSVQWNPSSERWELLVDYHGFLFQALAMQLALSIAGSDSLYTCSGCGAPYVRELKRPKPGTANYCPKCSEKGVAQRRAVDAYREKKAEALRLDAAGIVVDEIAEKLSTPGSRIRKWLGKKRPAEKKLQKGRR